MTCPMNQQFEMGDVEEAVYREHLSQCRQCQATQALDQELLDLCRELREPVNAPGLWSRIESEIQSTSSGFRLFSGKGAAFLALAAALVLAFGLGFYMAPAREHKAVTGLLTSDLLDKVRSMEAEYETAIAALEDRTAGNLKEMEEGFQQLYRQRLALIDQQIDQYKRELKQNPANAHLRDYLLAALKDKRETLAEILNHPEAS